MTKRFVGVHALDLDNRSIGDFFFGHKKLTKTESNYRSNFVSDSNFSFPLDVRQFYWTLDSVLPFSIIATSYRIKSIVDASKVHLLSVLSNEVIEWQRKKLKTYCEVFEVHWERQMSANCSTSHLVVLIKRCRAVCHEILVETSFLIEDPRLILIPKAFSIPQWPTFIFYGWKYQTAATTLESTQKKHASPRKPVLNAGHVEMHFVVDFS